MRTEFANWEGTKRTNGAGMQTLIERREGALGGYQRGVTGPEGWVSDLGYCLKSCKVFAKPGSVRNLESCIPPASSSPEISHTRCSNCLVCPVS